MLVTVIVSSIINYKIKLKKASITHFDDTACNDGLSYEYRLTPLFLVKIHRPEQMI